MGAHYFSDFDYFFCLPIRRPFFFVCWQLHVARSMPPKVKTVKGDEAKNVVKEYMLAQNRPFGAGDVSSNLKNAVGKAEAVRVLDALVGEGVLDSKDYKKFRYYWANQSSSLL